MKFRCKISNDGIKILGNIVNSLLKIPSSSSASTAGAASSSTSAFGSTTLSSSGGSGSNENVTFVLSEDYLRIVILSEGIVDSPRVFIELSTNLLYLEHQIESQHPNNLILFEMNLTLFSKALTSGKSSMYTVLKLTKKDNKPYLSMECKAADSLLSVDLVHDIPINLIRILDYSLFLPPNISKPSIAFQLPKTKIFKTLVDRLSKLNKVLYLIGQTYVPTTVTTTGHLDNSTRYGQLKLQTENNNVKIQSFLNNLPLSSKLFSEEEQGNQRTSSIHSSAPVVISVYSKKFSLILDYQNVAYHEANLFMTPNEALVLHLDLMPLGIGSISYYLPVLINEESLVTTSSVPQSGTTSKKKSPIKRKEVGDDRYDDINLVEVKARLYRRKDHDEESNDDEDLTVIEKDKEEGSEFDADETQLPEQENTYSEDEENMTLHRSHARSLPESHSILLSNSTFNN